MCFFGRSPDARRCRCGHEDNEEQHTIQYNLLNDEDNSRGFAARNNRCREFLI
jgi:hypothetical protein